MGALCVDDTCSILASVNPISRRLQLDARLDPTGGLECGTDASPNSGLRIKLDDGACFPYLSLNGSGELVGVAPDVKLGFAQTVEADNVLIPETTDDEVVVCQTDITNPYDCPVWMLVHGRFDLRYEVTADDGNNEAYTASVRFTNEIGGSNSVVLGASAVHMDIGGYATTGISTGTKRRWQYFLNDARIAAGGTVSVEMRANNFSPTQYNNVDVHSGANGASGHFRVLLFPQDRDASPTL